MKARSASISEISKFLGSVPSFSELSEPSITALARAGRFESFTKGEILFFQADPSDAAYLVSSGNISIVLNSPDGREMVINEMQVGDLFGELGILTRKSHSTSAIARTKSEVVAIPRRALRKIVESEHQVTIRLLEITADRLQMSGERESALAFMDAQARLARLLLELEKQEEDKGYVTISQDELAHRTGLIRQTVAKALGKWRRAGWFI